MLKLLSTGDIRYVLFFGVNYMEDLQAVFSECDIWWQYIAFATSRQRHFIFTYELCPLNGHPSEPSAWIGCGTVPSSHSRVSSISQFILFTKGVLFHWWVQSIDHCYPDESNSIKWGLHRGPQDKGLSETCSERIGAAIHRLLREKVMNIAWPALHLLPFSCLIL